MTERRYAVEERVGCVAVIDTTRFTGPGCLSDSPGVLKRWQGRPVPQWKKWLGMEPNWAGWEVERWKLRAARLLADRMNREGARNSIGIEAGKVAP